MNLILPVFSEVILNYINIQLWNTWCDILNYNSTMPIFSQVVGEPEAPHDVCIDAHIRAPGPGTPGQQSAHTTTQVLQVSTLGIIYNLYMSVSCKQTHQLFYSRPGSSSECIKYKNYLFAKTNITSTTKMVVVSEVLCVSALCI